MIQKHKKISARILSLALSVVMVTTILPMSVFAAEGDAPLGASAVGTIQSFDKLGDRFIPTMGNDAPDHIYGLTVEPNTPFEDLNLPDEVTAMVARTTAVSAPTEDAPVVDTSKPSEPTEEKTMLTVAEAPLPDEEKVLEDDAAAEDAVSGNQPASPSNAEEEVKVETTEIKDEDVPLAPEPDEKTTVTATKQESIPVTWTGNKEYQPNENGTFIYTAVLPQGYNLADGVKLPQIYVTAGIQARAASDAITIRVNSTVTASGATLQDAIAASSIPNADIDRLEIIEGTVTTADWGALSSLVAMNSFEIAESVAHVADTPTASPRTFPTSIVSVTVPQAISIGTNTFNGCNKLETAIFPNATYIELGAFWNCSELTDVNFDAVTEIGFHAFRNCSQLGNASFPAVTEIGFAAFKACTSLTSATFPRMTEINNQAFSECGILANLKLGATPPTVGANAFDGGPALRTLGYVGANGNALTGAALVRAIEDYDLEAMADGTWNGWIIAAPGPEVSKPSNLPVERKDTSITLRPVIVAGETIEYACSLSNEAPKTGWQTSPTFTELTESTPYYFFARAKASTTHKAGAPSAPVRIDTAAGDYTGKEADAPSGVPAVKTDTTVTLVPVTVTGETIEYAYSTSSIAPTTGWQDSTAFTGMTANTQYYFFARVKATATHKVGKSSAGTAIKTDMTEAQKVAAAKPLAEAAITNLTATNATTAAGILSTVDTAIISITGVTVTWKAAPTITAATNSAPGSISGTIVLTCGAATVEVTVSKVIAQLGNDAEKVANAKAAAVAALGSYTATNATADSDIMALVNNAITDAGIAGITAEWKTGSGFAKTNATASANGSVTGTITLKLNSAEADVVINFTIAQLADKATLTAAITAANNAKSGITVSENAESSVTSGVNFVTTAEMKALTDAVAAAQTVANNPASTADQVSAAIITLNNAVATFNVAIKTGTYSGNSGGGGSSSGGGSSTTPPTKRTEPVKGESNITATVDKNGNETANVTEKNITDAVKAAKDAATKKRCKCR